MNLILAILLSLFLNHAKHVHRFFLCLCLSLDFFSTPLFTRLSSWKIQPFARGTGHPVTFLCFHQRWSHVLICSVNVKVLTQWQDEKRAAVRCPVFLLLCLCPSLHPVSHLHVALHLPNRLHKKVVVLAPSSNKPGERETVVDSGVQVHMLNKNDWSSDELDTHRKSKNPTTVVTANGEVQTNEEAQVKVYDMDLFVTVQLLEDTLAVPTLGKLCEEHGYSFHIWPRMGK